MSSFIYLGDFSSILPYDKILKFAETANWQQVCSSETDHSKSNRPLKEQKQSTYYNKHNASRFDAVVKDQNFFTPEWFRVFRIKNQDYQAKIYKTLPGNIEPPHIDFFPSFIGHTDKEGKLHSQEYIAEQSKKIIRLWIPLQDSELGHLLFSPDQVVDKWVKGNVWELVGGKTHGFVNAGRKPRLVLVFTGWRA